MDEISLCAVGGALRGRGAGLQPGAPRIGRPGTPVIADDPMLVKGTWPCTMMVAAHRLGEAVAVIAGQVVRVYVVGDPIGDGEVSQALPGVLLEPSLPGHERSARMLESPLISVAIGFGVVRQTHGRW
jgi:hypothetical protein